MSQPWEIDSLPPCYVTLKRYSNKFQHCFVTSQQSLWTELPQAGTKATPDTRVGRKEMFYLTTHSTHFIYGYMASLTQEMGKKRKKKRETGFCQTSSTLDCRRVEQIVVFWPMQQFAPRHIHSRRPLGNHFDKQYDVATMKHPLSQMILGSMSCRGAAGLI